MKKYQVTLTDDQLKTVLSALELKARIGIGQFNEIWWQFDKRITHDRSIENLGDLLAMKLGLKNLSVSKSHPESKRCWDIFQVLRQHWHREHKRPGDGYSVWDNDPLFTSDVSAQPPCIVSLPDEHETLLEVSLPSQKEKETPSQQS